MSENTSTIKVFKRKHVRVWIQLNLLNWGRYSFCSFFIAPCFISSSVRVFINMVYFYISVAVFKAFIFQIQIFFFCPVNTNHGHKIANSSWAIANLYIYTTVSSDFFHKAYPLVSIVGMPGQWGPNRLNYDSKSQKKNPTVYRPWPLNLKLVCLFLTFFFSSPTYPGDSNCFNSCQEEINNMQL